MTGRKPELGTGTPAKAPAAVLIGTVGKSAFIYGLVAAATNSTYPSMILHAGGNMFSMASFFTQGRSEWQLTVVAPPTIWQSGVDAAFVTTLILLFAVGTATVFAFRALFRAGPQYSRRTP